jgi:hypothetical protein
MTTVWVVINSQRSKYTSRGPSQFSQFEVFSEYLSKFRSSSSSSSSSTAPQSLEAQEQDIQRWQNQQNQQKQQTEPKKNVIKSVTQKAGKSGSGSGSANNNNNNNNNGRHAHDMTIFQYMKYLNTTFLPKKLVLHPYTPNPKHAIVTLANKPYSALAVTLVASLREVKTRVPNIIVISHDNNPINEDAIQQIKQLGGDPRIIPAIKHTSAMNIPGGEGTFWGAAWTKLSVWNMTEFEKVVYIDADCMAVNNFDHLFNMNEVASPSTTPSCGIGPTIFSEELMDQGYFHIGTGIFVAEPNKEVYKHMLDLSTRPMPLGPNDNPIAAHWHWGDMQMVKYVFYREQKKWTRLDQREYDVLMGNCHDPQIDPDIVKTIHFTCVPYAKPWAIPLDMSAEVMPCVKKSHQLWYWMFTKVSPKNDYWGLHNFYGQRALPS